MYVLIMSAELAEKYNVTTQDAVNAVIKNPEQYPGAKVQMIKSQNTWNTVNGTYTVPEGQYLTRYFFVAGPTASGDDTAGNLIDNVWFSTQVPPPIAGKGNLEIRKVITGDLSNTEVETLQNSISFTCAISGSEITLSGDDMSWSMVDGQLTGIYTIQNIEIANTSVSAIVTENTDVADVTNYTRTTTVAVGDAAAFAGSSATVNVQEQKTASVTFTNSYVVNTADVTVTKTVDGNLGDRSKDFTFTATLRNAAGQSISFPAPQSGDPSYTVSGDTATFTLAHGENVVLKNLPIGAQLTIAENVDGYSATVKQGNTTLTESPEGTVVITVTARAASVDYTNTNSGLIDTGILLDTLPYVLLLVVVAAVAVVMICRKRKRYSDD